jgi:hypothetical protein
MKIILQRYLALFVATTAVVLGEHQHEVRQASSDGGLNRVRFRFSRVLTKTNVCHMTIAHRAPVCFSVALLAEQLLSQLQTLQSPQSCKHSWIVI